MYLLGTLNMGLIYEKAKKNASVVHGYIDVDYDRDLNRRRSQSGYVFTVLSNTVS